MHFVLHAVLLICVGLVFVFFSTLWVIEMLDKVSTLREYAPWVVAFAESKKWHAVVLVICWIFLSVDGVELYLKELPEIPPAPLIEIRSPAGPTLSITHVNPPMKEQCWMQNITLPAPKTIPSAQSATETLMFCNYERKAPLFLVVDYDKPPILYGPVLFPEGRHLSIQQRTEAKRIFLKIDSPSILPYQVFLVTAYGGDEKPPLATQMRITPINTER